MAATQLRGEVLFLPNQMKLKSMALKQESHYLFRLGNALSYKYLSPILSSETLKPAFDNILPALFGGLGVVYISKNFKLAIAPLVFMIVLFICVPSLASSVGVLVPVGSLLAIGVGRIMYKKGWV